MRNTYLSRLRLLVPLPVSTEPLARTLRHLDSRRGAWDQLVVSGTVGATDGLMCSILGAESAGAQGADPRTSDFLDRFVRVMKLHCASRKGNRRLQALKTSETHIPTWKSSLRHKMDASARLPARVGIHHLM